MVDDIVASGVDVYVSALHPYHKFNMAVANEEGSPSQLVCFEVVSMNTVLLIRHGSAP